MLRHKGRSALSTTTLVGSALAVYVQAFPRQPDRQTEADATSMGGHMLAQTSSAEAAEAQPITEHPEQRLTAREQDTRETLQTTPGRSEDPRPTLERERQAVRGQLGSLPISYEEQLERSPAVITSKGGPSSAGVEGFPALPLPPALEELIGLPQTYTAARSSYLALITSEAEQRGLPSALADAVAQVESRYNPKVVGSRGEVGLMQIRPQTAALLGYKGEVTALFEPETNVRLGVAYLARAWQLTKGDVCRTLMKYRAGWGEERMTPLSVEYCRRARGHLAAIGSPLADEAQPAKDGPETLVVAQQQTPQPASALVVARPLAGARQLAAALVVQTSVKTGPPLRLASLRTIPPHLADQAQAGPKAPEVKALPSNKIKTRVQATASVATSAPLSQPNTWQLLPLRQVSLAKVQLMNPAGPQPGMLPNTRQALAPEPNTKGSPIQNVARAQASTQAGRSSDQLEPPLSVKGARGVSLAAVQAGTRPKAQEAGQIAPVRNRPSVPAKSPQLAFAASLGTVEPSEDHPQVHPKPRETGALPSEENTARMQRAALQGFSAPPSLTAARPQPLLSVRVAGREVVRPAEPRVGTLPDAQEARAAPDENPGGVPTRAPQLTAASTPPSPAAHRLVPATSNRVGALGTAKVRSEDQVHAAPMPATPRAQPADAADLATTAAKQAQELIPLPPVR